MKRVMRKHVIAICSSAAFYKQVLEIEKQLKQLGFKVLVPATAYKMQKSGNFNVDVHKTWFKNKNDYKKKTQLMDAHFKKVIASDAILVINHKKNGIGGYIGGNVLMEMTLAYHYKKKIFVWNDIVSSLSIEEEVRGLNPIFIQQNILNMSDSFPEMVDIVDKDNKLLRSIAKKEAHKKGFLHRTILGQLINSKGEWILVKQSSSRQDAGQYVSPVGGHVRAGESEVGALRRETAEEVGLKDFKYKLVGRGIFNRQVLGRKENHYFILYEIYSGGKLNLGPEAESYRVFTKMEIKRLLKVNPKLFGNAFHFGINAFYPQFATGEEGRKGV